MPTDRMVAERPVHTGPAVPGPDSLRDLLGPALRRHARRRAVVADGRTWTYRQLDEAAHAMAARLRRLGVGSGSPVAIALHNSAEYVVADLAIMLLGATKVPINPMLSPDEHRYILDDSASTVCITDPQRIAEIAPPPDVTVVTFDDGDDGGGNDDNDNDAGSSAYVELPAVAPDSLGLIMYTGGTTGSPKGVQHSQRGLTANLLSHLVETEIVAEDILLLTSPLPHSAGFLLQAALTKGATVFIEPGFDLEVVLRRIEVDRASFMFLVPTMIYRLLDAVAERESFDGSSVRTILYGAAPITVDRLQQGLSQFGQVFEQLYGQSEAPNFLTRLRRDDHRSDLGGDDRLRSCGQSVAMATVRTVRQDGTFCEPGEVGEVIASSPYTMRGYLGLPDQTAESVRDGWLYTGDLGYLDHDGYLFLVDRKKDLIITGGLNVYSSEVENALSRLPGVREVAVAGLPHPDWGEAVVAFVVLDSAETSVEQVGAGARSALSAYKRPKRIVALDQLPMTAIGKVDKKRMRARFPGF